MDEQILLQGTKRQVKRDTSSPFLKDLFQSPYYGYFENEQGILNIFHFDWAKEQGTFIREEGSSVQTYPVSNGQVTNLFLNTAEQLWLCACSKAATKLLERYKMEKGVVQSNHLLCDGMYDETAMGNFQA